MSNHIANSVILQPCDAQDREEEPSWLGDAGFDAELTWSYRDLALLHATRR